MLALFLNPVNKKVRKMKKIRIYHNTNYSLKMGKINGGWKIFMVLFYLYREFAEPVRKLLPH